MDIENFYNSLEIPKKKPLLIIGKTKTPAAEYDPFSRKIILNEELSKSLTEIELKLMLCHELGHYLNFWIVVLFKIIGVALILSAILFFAIGLMVMGKPIFSLECYFGCYRLC